MRPVARRVFVLLSLGIVLAACSGGASGGASATPGPVGAGSSATPVPSASPCAAASADPMASPSTTACPGGGAGGGSGVGSAGGTAGGPGAWITRTWSEVVTVTDTGMSSVISQAYQATVSLTLTKVDIGAWQIAGRASITSSFTSDFRSHFDSPLGPCDQHYTDDASGSGSVVVNGGLEYRDEFYQFYVSIPGLDGSSVAVRDDSGCNGTSTTEAVPWSVAPITAAGSGSATGTTLSGQVTQPREGGEDTTTWNITVDP